MIIESAGDTSKDTNFNEIKIHCVRDWMLISSLEFAANIMHQVANWSLCIELCSGERVMSN